MEIKLIESKVCNTCKLSKPISEYRGNRKKCEKCNNKNRYKQKKERILIDLDYRNELRARDVDRKRRKERTDEMAAFKQTIRSSDRGAFRRHGYPKDSKTEQRLGIGWEEFKIYFENKFTDGMSWANKGEWEDDHIIPLALAINQDEVNELSHYTNRQPLWAMENKLKSDKIYFHQLTDELITRYEKYIIRYLIKHNMMP